MQIRYQAKIKMSGFYKIRTGIIFCEFIALAGFNLTIFIFAIQQSFCMIASTSCIPSKVNKVNYVPYIRITSK